MLDYGRKFYSLSTTEIICLLFSIVFGVCYCASVCVGVYVTTISILIVRVGINLIPNPNPNVLREMKVEYTPIVEEDSTSLQLHKTAPKLEWKDTSSRIQH